MDKFTELYEQLMGENSSFSPYSKSRTSSAKKNFIRGAARAMGSEDPYKKNNFSTGGPAGGYAPSGSSRGFKTSAKEGEAIHRAKMDHRSDREKDAAARAAWANDRRNPEARARLDAQRKKDEAARFAKHRQKAASQQAMYQQYLRSQGKL